MTWMSASVAASTAKRGQSHSAHDVNVSTEMFRVVALLILLTSADAHADGRWSVAFGGGPAVFRVGGTPELADGSQHGGVKLGATARLDAGFRVADKVAFGTHLGLAYVEAKYSRSVAGPTTYVPFELGLGAQVTIGDQLLVAPWVGPIDMSGRSFLAAGITVGFDMIERAHERLAVVASFTHAREHLRSYPATYDAFSVGIAYRYW